MRQSGPIARKPRKMTTLTCEDCDIEFERRADKVTRASDDAIRCTECSYAKRAANLTGGILPSLRQGLTLTCAVCSTEFWVPPSRRNQMTCSKTCQAERRSRQDTDPAAANLIRHAPDNRGERNGRFKTGERVGERALYEPKNKVRAAVAERDGNWCLCCGRPGPGLHLHRVIYGSQGGKYETGNCVQLCNEHHALMHSSKKTWMPKLLAYLESPADFPFLDPHTI